MHPKIEKLLNQIKIHSSQQSCQVTVAELQEIMSKLQMLAPKNPKWISK